jgi:hypothetical protein
VPQPSISNLTPPGISLPKGGGAIRGLGEKVTPQTATGSCRFAVPIFTSPGRAGFSPQLTLTYDSSYGNGPFGLGWRLSIPSITRKTAKGLPRYRDDEESDVFMFADVDDLVPVYEQDRQGNWIVDAHGHFVVHEKSRTVDCKIYTVRHY